MTIFGWVAMATVCLVGVVTALEHVRNRSVQSVPSRPRVPATTQENQILEAFALRHELPEAVLDAQIEAICAYIDARYDCSDFRAITLLRILYGYHERLSAGRRTRIETSLSSFKFWLDEPGDDSMCYWSENHQILFSACEFLAGRWMPDRVFSNDGRTGRDHASCAKERILTWLELRWRYGFTEWYSSVYYTEDVAALANLIDFAGDAEIEARCTIVLDLLLYDVASQNFQGVLVSSSGRLYENQKKRPDTASIVPVLREMRGEPIGSCAGSMIANFVYRKGYRIPEVLSLIARYDGPVELLGSHGLDLDEVRSAGLIGLSNRQIMTQWGMESFTNPQTLANTMRAFNRFGMFRQAPFRALNHLRHTILRLPGVYALISRTLQPQSNGVAIERANTCTYKSAHYILATTQAYHPGSFGDQHHVWHAALSPTACAFTTHPARLPGQTAPFGNSPGYWVGSGRLPHSVQHRTVNLTLYDLPRRSGALSGTVLPFTHAWLPESEFDEVRQIRSGLAARLGNAWLALLTAGPFDYRSEQGGDSATRNEVVQTGYVAGWVCTVSSLHDGETFAQFIERLDASRVALTPRTRGNPSRLVYTGTTGQYRLDFGGAFFVNGTPVDTDHPRAHSIFCAAGREPESIDICCEDNALHLDYTAVSRRETRANNPRTTSA